MWRCTSERLTKKARYDRKDRSPAPTFFVCFRGFSSNSLRLGRSEMSSFGQDGGTLTEGFSYE